MIMNHSQVEIAEQMEVVNNDISIAAALNAKDSIQNLYERTSNNLPSDSEMSESVEDAEESDSSSNSSGLSSSTTSTSTDEEDYNNEEIPDNAFEIAKIANVELRLPRELCESATIFNEFFSLDTWHSLPQEMQNELEELLPQFDHLNNAQQVAFEKEQTVKMLFENELNAFGRTPLQALQRELEEGNYRPDVLQYHESIAKSKRRERRFRKCENLSQIAKELFISREHLLQTAYKSAPDTILRSERYRKTKNISDLNSDTKLYAVRARKRFQNELLNLAQKCSVDIKELNSDEDINELLSGLSQDDIHKQINPTDDPNSQNALNTNSADKKCIYNTLFKRIQGMDDQDAVRIEQQSKQTRLSNKNFRQYLRDYKIRKQAEPNLAEYETSDIRLRDVCARAQMGGNFKRIFAINKAPGKKLKPNSSMLSEPPALVPIQPQRKYEQNTKHEDQIKTTLPNTHDLPPLTKTLLTHTNIAYKTEQQKAFKLLESQDFFTSQDQSSPMLHEDNEVFHILGGEVELQQEEVETYNNTEGTIPAFVISNEVVVEQNPELPQNVLQAAQLNDEPPLKRQHRAPEFGNMTGMTTQNIPKLEPISGRTLVSNNNVNLRHKAIGSKQLLNKSIPISSRKSQQQQTLQSVNTVSATAYTANPELIQETHACFFALIRDFFCATQNHRMRFDDLKDKMDIWLRNPITALNDWYMQAENWPLLLTSAIKFLAGDFTNLPEEYVPYIEHKTQLNIYQWIGAGRDSDTRLTELCTFWLQRRKEGFVDKLLGKNDDCNGSTPILQRRVAEIEESNYESGVTPPPPPPRYPTNWTVRPATPQEIEEFHRQERERFENPHRAYTYRMHGYESVVGPVKGIYSQILALTKARGHSIMVGDRPNFVTILTLVRDATARLPNGEGTRADISELLKCSQYINQDAAENVLQSVVSGALDRMHTEHDPCVRYDPKRKIWIYLHRNRTVDEFERMHQQNQGIGKQKRPIARKPKVKGSLSKESNTNDIEPMSSSVMTNNISNAPVTLLTPVSNFTLPALVPANSIIVNKSLINKQAPQPQPLPQPAISKCPPVPPLKYNIPTQIQQQQQKSLLKTIQRSVDAKTATAIVSTTSPIQQRTVTRIGNNNTPTNSATLQTNLTNNKQFNISVSQTKSTPIIVATPNGLQTVHVASSNSGTPTVITQQNTNTPVLSATVGGKKVALNKPIIINQITQQTPPKPRTVQATKQTLQHQQQHHQQQQQQHLQQTPQLQSNFIIPIDPSASNSKDNKLRNIQTLIVDQSQLIQGPGTSVNVTETSLQQQPQQQLQPTTHQQAQQPKNIIRLVPALNTTGQVKSIISTTPVTGTKQPVQIIGQRVIANTTVRPQQKSIAGISIINSTASGTANQTSQQLTTTGGAIVKMSPQAFAALQQKQGGQQTILIKQSAATNQTQQQSQQRIVLGNTAIVAANQSNASNVSTSVGLLNTSSTVTATSKGTTTINAQNLTPQQQRILIQNLKQQQQIQFKTVQVVSTNNQNITQQEGHTQTNTLGPTQTLTIVPQRTAAAVQTSGIVSQQQSSGKGMTVVVSQAQGVTRLLKTTNNQQQQQSPQQQQQQQQQLQQQINTTGQIISLESLIQKQGGAIRITGNSGNIVKNTSGQATNIIQIAGGNVTHQTGATQYAVVSQPRSIITLGTPQRLITTQANNTATLLTTPVNVAAKEVTKVSGSITAGRIVTSNVNASNQGATTTTTNARILGKTTVVATSGGNFNLSQLQGKQVVFTTKTAGNLKNITNVNTSQAQQLQSAGVILGGQTVKLQTNQANLQQLSKTGVITSQGTPQLQTVIMGNQILKVQQLTTPGQSRIVSNATVSPITTITNANNNAGTIVVNSGDNIRSLPKTLVIGSAGQTIRLQPAITTQANTKQVGTQQQQITQIGTAKNPIPGNRVMFTVPGSNQIFLSSNFQGAALNIKQLQNMKVVSLAPQSNTTSTILKTDGSNNSDNTSPGGSGG